MKKITALMLFLSSMWGHSQVRNYTFEQSAGTYTPITGGTFLGNESTDLQVFVDPAAPLGGSTTGIGFDIGFNFTFNGYVYDKFAVSADGWISLGSSSVTPSVNISSGTIPLSATSTTVPDVLSARIAALAKDLSAQAGSSLRFQTIGVAPNRTLVVQWEKYKKALAAGNGDNLNFQIRLNESTNTVNIVYGACVQAIATGSNPYQVGLRAEPAAVATNFLNRKSLTGWDNTAAGTAPADTVGMTYMLVPSNGLTYTWTPPTCGGAKAAVASAVSTSGMTLNLAAYAPGADSYEYKFGTSATLPLPTDSGTATTNTTVSFSDLNPNTAYNMFVRTKCGSTFTAWVLSGTFKTKCLEATTYFEDFDTYNTTSILPDCWDKGATTGTSIITSGALSPMTPSNSLNLTANGSAATPTVAYAIMPPASNLSAGTNRLRFTAYTKAGTDRTLDVGYFTNPNDVSTFTVIQTVTLPGTAVTNALKLTVPVPSTVPSTVKNLVFRNKGATTAGTAGTTATDAYIDDVVYEPNPVCTDITVTTISQITDTTARFSWTKAGTETEWQYAYGLSTVLNPNSLTPVPFSGATQQVVVSGLTPSTSYRMWVRPKCSESVYGAWIGSPVFTTTATPIAQFLENFDAAPALPAGWLKIGTTGTVSINSNTSSPPSTPPLYLYIQNTSATEPAIVSLPPVSNSGAATSVLRFKANPQHNTGDKLDVGYLTDISDPTSFVSLQTVNLTTNTAFNLYTVSLGTTALSPYLAIRNNSNPTAGIRIDDVSWEPTPKAGDVTALTATYITGSTAGISWTASTGNPVESAWQYVLAPSTLKDPSSVTTPVNASTTTLPLTGLTPSTSYKIWVRSKLSDTSLGSWIGPLIFTTSCNSITDFSQNFDNGTTLPDCWTKIGTKGSATITSLLGTNALYLNNAVTTPTIVSMPPVSNSADGTYRLRLNAKANAVGQKLEVGYMSAGAFVSLKDYTTTQADTFVNMSFELGTDPATDILAFQYNGSGAYTIDDVAWEPIPSCADVKSVAVTGTTGSSATVSWTKGGTETKWQYVIGSASASSTAGLSPVEVTSITSPVTINGLAPSTSYKIWVRSKCSTTDLGTWIGPYIATTACASSTEFSQNFDSSTTFPDCWTKVGGGGAAYPGALTDAPSKSNVLNLNSPNGSSQGIVAMPPLSNLTVADHVLRFKCKGSVAGITLEVGYLLNLTDAGSFVPFTNGSITTSNTAFQTKTVTISGTPLSNILAFRNKGNANGTIYIDDVSWDIAPTTVPACATGSNYGTLISWPAVAGADGYKISVGTTPGGTDIANNTDLSVALNYSLAATVGTAYYTIKPYNAIGTAAGCEQTYNPAVNTCNCVSLPTSKDGTGVTNVTIGGSSFANTSVTYNDFTSKTVNAIKGDNTMQVSFNTGTTYKAYVWIDLDKNYKFDPSELLYTGTSGATGYNTLSFTLTIPDTAASGVYNMRIGTSKSANTTQADPCYSGASAVTLDFKVNLVTPIDNDAPTGAVTLTVGTDFASNAITGTNVDATGSLAETTPTCGGYNGMDVWYKATVPTSGNLVFEVNSVSGGITNTAAAAYSGSIGSLTLLGCDDSSSSVAAKSTTDDQPRIALTGRTAGEVIYFRVWTNGGGSVGTYKVSAYDAVVLDLDTFNFTNFSYYPNPVTDVMNISFDQEINNVSVVNLLGQQVFSQSLNANHGKLDMSALPRGAYLVRVTAGNHSKTIKVIKE